MGGVRRLSDEATGTGWERTPWHATQRAGVGGATTDQRGRLGRPDVVSQDAVLFSFLFGSLGRQSTPNADEIEECRESTYDNHEHR